MELKLKLAYISFIGAFLLFQGTLTYLGGIDVLYELINPLRTEYFNKYTCPRRIDTYYETEREREETEFNEEWCKEYYYEKHS